MTAGAAMTRRGRLSLWLLVAAGLALVIGANWHLVYVAVTSQPDCVAHVRPGTGEAARTTVFSAAKSACSPG
ncbi:MAG: hypothetical protein KDJ76_10575 [Xanthobacteraceae bacterium]|nr:hypothetical protein [Xanthobacteraceae bacterium]